MADNSGKGFTLLELLISLTIVALIVVVIFGAFRIGIRAWEKGEEDIEVQQRRRIVLDLVKRQLASICLIPREGKLPLFLKGDDKSLEFISCLPAMPDNVLSGNKSGIVYVKYVVIPDEDEDEAENESLWFFEKNILLLEKDADFDDLDEEAFHELIPEALNLSFEYLKGRDEEGEYAWQQTWEPKEDGQIPLAVMITLIEDVKSDPVYVIARFEAEPAP